MKPEPLKNKLRTMYEDDYDTPFWCYSKDDCDYGNDRGQLHTHKFFDKSDVQSAIEWLKAEMVKEFSMFYAWKKLGIRKLGIRILPLIDKAFPDLKVKRRRKR